MQSYLHCIVIVFCVAFWRGLYIFMGFISSLESLFTISYLESCSLIKTHKLL
ncbi:hypothetical protein [Helicobacter cinaedi]|uniref:hypothetical protein n=1 Tax=Helicobacter cinaedi TaxID=213 RepID=UPI0015F0C724|nr:hypothetical protein [Helicobacter cinaedi]